MSVREVNIDRIIADIEHVLDGIPINKRDQSWLESRQVIRYRDIRHSSKYVYQEAIKFLKQNSAVVVVTSDKGNVTVIMDRVDYNNTIRDILQTDSFKQINNDPTLTIQNKANKYIAKLSTLNIIDDTTAKNMKTYNSVALKFYGNPKVHKEDCPLRLIVSSINSPTNELAWYLSEIFTKAYNKENDYYVISLCRTHKKL